MESSQCRERQYSEEGDWEKVPTPVYPLTVTEVNAQNGNLELRVTVADSQEIEEGASVLLVPSDFSESGDVNSCPLGLLSQEKSAVIFRNGTVHGIGSANRFHLVLKEGGLLLSSDFSISEIKEALDVDRSLMIASVEDWDDGILPCTEEQQKLLDRMEEEITKSRTLIHSLEEKEEQLKLKVSQLEGMAARTENEKEELMMQLRSSMAELDESTNQVRMKDAALATANERFMKLEGELAGAAIEIQGLKKLGQEDKLLNSKQLDAALAEVETLKKRLSEEEDEKGNLMQTNQQLLLQLEQATAAKSETQMLQNQLLEEKIRMDKENETLMLQVEELKAAVDSLTSDKEQCVMNLREEIIAEKEENKKLEAEITRIQIESNGLEVELKSKMQAIAERLVEESKKCDGFARESENMEKRNDELEKQVVKMVAEMKEKDDQIADLTNQVEEKDDLLGRRIQEVESAEANLKRGLSFWPKMKHQVDTIVTTLYTEMEGLKRLKESSETAKKALACVKLCHQSVRTVKEEMDEFQLNTEVDVSSSLRLLPRINDDITKMSREELMMMIDDLKARIKEAYKDYRRVNEELKEVRKQNVSGQASMPVIKKSEGDVKKWLKDVEEGGTNAIFAGTVECRTAGGNRQCILPTFFKDSCKSTQSASFAIEDLGSGTCASCPRMKNDIEVWLKPAAIGANRGRSTFVDVSSSFSYKPVPDVQKAEEEKDAEEVVDDPDEDVEFYDASYCEYVPQEVMPQQENKRYPCPDCSHIFEASEQAEFEQHLALHAMYANESPVDDLFNSGY